MKWIRKVLVVLFVVLSVGGVVTNSAESDLSVLRRSGEMLFLWIAAAVVLVHTPTGVASLFMGAMIGFLSEVLGVTTGLPFGYYHYTDTLGFAIAGVPVVMLAAWMVLLAYAWSLASVITVRASYCRWVAALIMTAFDLLIDPVAIGPLHLWTWDQSGSYYGVPLVNFAGWFVVSWIALVPLSGQRKQHPASHLVGFAIITFFTIHAIRSELIVAALVGIGLLAMDVWVCWCWWMQYFVTWKPLSALRSKQ